MGFMSARSRRWLSRLIACGAMLLSGVGLALGQGAPGGVVRVYAAASLKTALDEVVKTYSDDGGGAVSVSYASSAALARQIEHGAPADVFISADLDWMEYLAARGLIDPATRRTLVGNRLVLVAPNDSQISITIEHGFKLADALAGGRLAVGDVTAVPAGKYAKAALESLGVWSSVAGTLAPAENVRAALAFVAMGEAPLGIVYATDAAAEPKLRIVGEFPASSHPAIVYPAAVIAGSAAPERARGLLDALGSSTAQAIFERYGFRRLP